MYLLSLLVYHRESIAFRPRGPRFFSSLVGALLFLPLPLPLVPSAELRMRMQDHKTISVTRPTDRQSGL